MLLLLQGSIGAQLWGNQAVTRLNWNQAAVMPDSYAGVFPPDSQGPLIYNFVSHDLHFLSACTIVGFDL